MKQERILRRVSAFVLLVLLPAARTPADGAYFSSRSVAVSADQRAIIIKNGNQISLALSTGYTGDGEDFGWIIPTPTPPNLENVTEASPRVRAAFDVLDELTAPVIRQGRGGCFPAGTDVLTAGGPRAIQTVEPGTEVYSCDLSTGQWRLRRVHERLTHRYVGDVVTVRLDRVTVEATGNHPFCVLRGELLSSRPIPRDLPAGEEPASARGRWVEARDLRVGDLLAAKGAEDLRVTGLSSRQATTEVYNLRVEGDHNYAVHRAGILVHNKGGAEKAWPPKVRVFGTVALEHYQVSILGAGAASDLLEWLREHDYQVDPQAREILDAYIARDWAFVAVKLNPSETRRYENEFLPPLVIQYRSEQLVFPVRISAVSTNRTARITLYVIAESTVRSSNYPTVSITYRSGLPESEDPEAYMETRIRKAAGGRGRRLALLWSGPFQTPAALQDSADEAMKELLEAPFPVSTRFFLTRLEARMDPEAMTDDIRFALDASPREFPPRRQGNPEWAAAVGIKTEPGFFTGTASASAGPYATFLLTTMVYPPNLIPAFGVDLLWSTNVLDTRAGSLAGIEANVSAIVASAGLSLAWELTAEEPIPYLGLRVRLLDIPPVTVSSSWVRAREPFVDIGLDLLPMTIRWNLQTGKPLFTLGLVSVTLGRLFMW